MPGAQLPEAQLPDARLPGVQLATPRTTPDAPVSGRAAPPARLSWQPWLSVLLPFTAIGLLPWWVCLALCAALVLSRLGEELNSIGALLILLAAVAVSLPLLFGAAPGRLLASGTLFAQTTVVGLLALASLRALEGGQRRGLLLPAAALLLFPSPLGLPALLLAGLGLTGAESRPRLQLESPSRGRTLALVLGTVLALLGAGLLLGRLFPSVPVPPSSFPGTVSAPKAALPSQFPPAAAQTGSAARPRTAPQIVPLAGDQELLLRPLVPLTGLLIVVCILLMVQRMRLKRAGGRSHWTEYVAVVALLGTLFMVGVLGAGAGPGRFLSGPLPAAEAGRGGGALQTADTGTKPAPAWIAPLLNAGIIFATLFFAAAAVYLYRTLRAERAEQRIGRPTDAANPDAETSLPPLHRVRLVWRGLEDVLADSGLARAESETPEEYAGRLSVLLPAAAADLYTLTRLYLPVRYGGVLSEHDASQAEASAQSIQAVLRDSNAVI